MDSKLKVTDVPEESSFYDLVAGDNVLEIPLFQRPYMWKESHYKGLLKDINIIDDDANGAAFLGVIVSFRRGGGPGRPPIWMVVDGQQRVSTLYLNILAAVEVAAKAGELDWAADVMGRYLLVRPMSGLTVNTKLIPSFSDRQQFSSIWTKILAIKNFGTHQIVATNPPRPPAPSGNQEGAMLAQYGRIRTDLGRLYREKGVGGLDTRVEIVATRLSMVSISLRDPTAAPKIFERLNYGAEPITVADLVRNEVFARSGDDPNAAMSLFNSRWEPFVAKFEDKNTDLDRFLFPYGLMHNPSVRKAELFPALRKQWDEGPKTPQAIIDDLEQYQPAYLALTSGKNYNQVEAKVKLRVDRIFRAGRPSSIYPFLLNLLRNYEKKLISEQNTIAVLDVVESFLFRRAVCGIEPTGLHAVFKGLWQELVSDGSDNGKPLEIAVTASTVRAAILAKPTISWPTDDQFKEAIIGGELYRRKIAPYAVKEYELSLKGESPADLHQVEHIAPQVPTTDWMRAIPRDYDKLKHTWGNLLPLTPNMNSMAGQEPFDAKRKKYNDSIFASAREVAKKEKWDADDIATRGERIASWAVMRWPNRE